MSVVIVPILLREIGDFDFRIKQKNAFLASRHFSGRISQRYIFYFTMQRSNKNIRFLVLKRPKNLLYNTISFTSPNANILNFAITFAFHWANLVYCLHLFWSILVLLLYWCILLIVYSIHWKIRRIFVASIKFAYLYELTNV